MKFIDKPGYMWSGLVDKHTADFNDYSNFRNTVSCSFMTDRNHQWFGFNNSEKDIKKYYDKIKSLDIDISCSDSLDGSPCHIIIDGKNITQDLLTTAEETDLLDKNIEMNNIQTVVEIGCGYGRTCRYILNKYPHIQYTIVDIHPTLDLSKRFLTQNSLINNITFMTPSEFISSLNTYDLSISISVFSELDKDQRLKYIEKISSVCKYFYLKERSLNDKEFDTSWNIIKKQSSRTTHTMDDYIFSIGKIDGK